MKLQKSSGLSEIDPMWHYLGLLDRLLTPCGSDFNWRNLSISPDDAVKLIIGCLNHPLNFKEVTDDQFDFLEKVLHQREPLFAEILNKLRRHKDREGIDNKSLRMVLFYLAVNLDLFREQSTSKWRSITA